MTWNDSGDKFEQMWNINQDPMKVPYICPYCDEKEGHMYMHVYNLKTHRGGLWLWCSACKQFFHSSVYVPTWWSNLPIVDENQLSAFPQYLDALSTRIDKHINQLISNKKHLVLPAK